MKVQIRTRRQADRPSGFSDDGGGGITPAYSDACFRSPTRFYTVAAEHQTLGKWAQPSTLRYCYPEAYAERAAQGLDNNASSSKITRVRAANRHWNASSRLRLSAPVVITTDCRRRAVGEKGTGARADGPGRWTSHVDTRTGRAKSTAKQARSGKIRDRAGRGSESAPLLSAVARPISEESGVHVVPGKGTLEPRPASAARIDTPVSGRVAPLHTRRQLHELPYPLSSASTARALRGSFGAVAATHALTDRTTPGSVVEERVPRKISGEAMTRCAPVATDGESTRGRVAPDDPSSGPPALEGEKRLESPLRRRLKGASGLATARMAEAGPPPPEEEPEIRYRVKLGEGVSLP